MSRTFYHNPTCEQCHRKFQSTRTDAKFCSARCRMAHSRSGDIFIADVTQLNRIAATLLQISQKYKDNQKMHEVMVSLRADLDAAINNFESVE